MDGPTGVSPLTPYARVRVLNGVALSGNGFARESYAHRTKFSKSFVGC